MKQETETFDQLQAMASWRVAVTQGLTLLGFKDWLIESGNHPRELRQNGESDRLARVGGEDFVVMLTTDARQHEAARCVASSIIAGSASPIQEPDLGRVLAGSLGIALFPNHAADADALLIAADRRRYEARRQGKGAISFAQG